MPSPVKSSRPIIIGIVVLFLSNCERAPNPPRTTRQISVQPHLETLVNDPGKTGFVRAAWLRYAGLRDSGSVPQHALLLELKEGAKAGAEAGVRLVGTKGQPVPRELGFDFQTGGTCTGEGPRLVLTTTDGRRHEFICGAGTKLPVPGEPGQKWTRVVFPMTAFPNGIGIDDLRVVALFTGSPTRIVVGGFVGFGVVVGWPGLHVYIADPGNQRILRIDNILTSGASSSITAFGTGGAGVNQFNLPADVDVDVNGHIYIADRLNDRIVRINDMTGSGWQTVVGPGTCGGMPSSNQMCKPTAVTVDGSGRIYVREYYTRTIRLDNMAGAGLTMVGPATTVSGMNWTPVQDVVLDGAWRIFSSDPFGHRVNRVDGITGAGSVDLNGPCPASIWYDGSILCFPIGLFVENSGRIYIGDGCRLVRVNDISGAGRTIFPASGACFQNGVQNVGVDTYGRIYFTAGNYHYRLWRMNDMSGAGLVEVAGVNSSNFGGLYVDDRGP